MAGHLRAAAGTPPDGQTARRIGLLSACGESVLSRQESSHGGEGLRNPNPAADAACAGPERNDPYDRCEGVHRVAGPAIAGCQEPEDRDAWLLYGRPDCASHS